MKKANIITDDLTNKKYVKVKEPDWDLISGFIYECAGEGKAISQFETQCGLSNSMLARYANGTRKNPPSLPVIHKVLEKADPDAHVTFNMFMAACGFIPLTLAHRLIEAQLPGLKDIPDFRRREYQNEEVAKYPVPDVEDFDRYLDNLTLFIDVSKSDPEALLKKAQELFANKMFVLSLEKWRCHFDADTFEELEEQKLFLEYNTNLSVKMGRCLSKSYQKVILETLKKMGVLEIEEKSA